MIVNLFYSPYRFFYQPEQNSQENRERQAVVKKHLVPYRLLLLHNFLTTRLRFVFLQHRLSDFQLPKDFDYAMELEAVSALGVLARGQPVLVLDQHAHALLLDQVLDVQACVALTDGCCVEEALTVSVDHVHVCLPHLTQDRHRVELPVDDRQM